MLSISKMSTIVSARGTNPIKMESQPTPACLRLGLVRTPGAEMMSFVSCPVDYQQCPTQCGLTHAAIAFHVKYGRGAFPQVQDRGVFFSRSRCSACSCGVRARGRTGGRGSRPPLAVALREICPATLNSPGICRTRAEVASATLVGIILEVALRPRASAFR